MYNYIKLGHISKNTMNNTEKKYDDILKMQLLAKIIKWYGFEKIKLRLGNNCFYTPDFSVVDNNNQLMIIEIKGGYIRDDSIVKFKTACEQYPFIKFKMVQYKNKEWKIIHEN